MCLLANVNHLFSVGCINFRSQQQIERTGGEPLLPDR